MTVEDATRVDFLVGAQISRSVMFLKTMGAEVTEGEFAGTTLCSGVAGGTPIVSVTRHGAHVATLWISTQDLIAAAIAKVMETVAPEVVE